MTNLILAIGTETVSGGGGGVKSFYLRSTFDTTASTNYFLMFSTPSPNAEVTKTASVASASGLVLLSSHATLSGGAGQDVRTLPAGFWQFVMFAGIDSIVNQTDLVIDVATMSKNSSNLTRIVSSTITNVNTLTPSLFVGESVLTTNVTISTDDRIVVTIYCKTTSVIARTVTLALEGTARSSRIGTTIQSFPVFISLDDAPSSYFGQSGKYVQVKTTEDGLQFAAVSGGSGDGNLTNAATQTVLLNNNPIDSISSATVTGAVNIGSGTFKGTFTDTSAVILTGDLVSWTTDFYNLGYVYQTRQSSAVGTNSTLPGYNFVVFEQLLSTGSQEYIAILTPVGPIDSTYDPYVDWAIAQSTGTDPNPIACTLATSTGVAGAGLAQTFGQLVWQSTISIVASTQGVADSNHYVTTAVPLTNWKTTWGSGQTLIYVKVTNTAGTSTCQRYWPTISIKKRRRT